MRILTDLVVTWLLYVTPAGVSSSSIPVTEMGKFLPRYTYLMVAL